MIATDTSGGLVVASWDFGGFQLDEGCRFGGLLSLFPFFLQ